MARVNHYLKRNHLTESPNNILIVDTEANIYKKFGLEFQTFRLGYAIHLLRQNGNWSRRGFVLRTIEDFWNLLDQCNYSKTKLYVFAHNMDYDYAILKLDTYISSRNLEIKMRVIDSVFIVKAGGIAFISSTNFYRKSLKELGTVFGLAKMDSPDFSNCSDKELLPYCIRDTEVLTKIIEQHIAFVVSNDLGSFKPTIAGQAMTAFRHRFMSHDLLVHNYDDILHMEKLSYRGGRCEVFKMGSFDDVTCLDINSTYSYVMKSFEYPTKLVSSKISFGVSEQNIRDALLKGLYVLADCYLILKKPCIAFKSEKLLFPIGKVHMVLTSPEIEYILDNPDCGEILTFDEVVFYEKARIFSEYVDYFYSLRCKNDNPAIKAMCKVMLNSLYGKFGQSNHSTPELVTDENSIKIHKQMMKELDTFEIFDGKSSKYVLIGNELYHVEKENGDFARDSIPIIASTVTAFARQMLWGLIQKAGIENVIYVDTDSLFVNPAGLANLEPYIDANELGKLKIEKTGCCTIRGAKDYTFNGKMKLKGIKENATKISDDTYIQQQFHTKNQRYRDGTPDGIVIVKEVTKKLSRNYDKGNVFSDGSVHPLIFDE
jgi:hypothetical protein